MAAFNSCNTSYLCQEWNYSLENCDCTALGDVTDGDVCSTSYDNYCSCVPEEIYEEGATPCDDYEETCFLKTCYGFGDCYSREEGDSYDLQK